MSTFSGSANSMLYIRRCGQQLVGPLEAPPARPPHVHLVAAEREWRLDNHADPDTAAPRIEVVGLPRRPVAYHPIADREYCHHQDLSRRQATPLTGRRDPVQRLVRPVCQEPSRLRLGFLICFTAWRRESR